MRAAVAAALVLCAAPALAGTRLMVNGAYCGDLSTLTWNKRPLYALVCNTQSPPTGQAGVLRLRCAKSGSVSSAISEKLREPCLSRVSRSTTSQHLRRHQRLRLHEHAPRFRRLHQRAHQRQTSPVRLPSARGQRTMKIYLASQYSRREELRGYMQELEKLGHAVTSRWLKFDHDLPIGGDPALGARFAREDFADLVAADLCISFTRDPSAPRTGRDRGGRHVEFGIAFGMAKGIWVVGFRENVFHYMEDVRFFPTWEDALAVARKLPRAA